jgi:hypothetical protein
MGAVAALADAEGIVHQDAQRKLVEMATGRGNLLLRLNYDGRCVLDQVTVRGRQVAAESGVSSGICVDGQWLTTRAGLSTPTIIVGKNTLIVKDIVFGRPGFEVYETWQFKVRTEDITWRISRRYPKAGRLEDAAFPEWDFSSLSTWTGGLLGNGGVVWTKYLETTNATYGAHAGTVTFWNRQQFDCLRITPTPAEDQHGAVRFSHQTNNNFSFSRTGRIFGGRSKQGLVR